MLAECENVESDNENKILKHIESSADFRSEISKFVLFLIVLIYYTL